MNVQFILLTGALLLSGWQGSYWYENGIKQGTEGRGKEIYDPSSDAWYWLDAIQGGAKAVSKDVYQESKADDFGNIGKWVRYDSQGHMVKGWDGAYYFNPTYGTMAKGEQVINGIPCYFDMQTGVGLDQQWYQGYWYEKGVRQGTTGRGKEIYDATSDSWYWLDAVQNGAIARNKDVYQESLADDSGTIGKWVRYDSAGHMVKGWDGDYYFDPTYGTMAKGLREIDGKTYYFNTETGVLAGELTYYYRDIRYTYEYAWKTGDTSKLTSFQQTVYAGLSACLTDALQYSTDYERELAVHNWLVLNCAYGKAGNHAHSFEGAFAEKQCVCSGYADAFDLCMNLLGIPCDVISGTSGGGNHSWNIVQLDGDWYHVDVTFDDPLPDRPGQVNHVYFNVTDEYLQKDHDWKHRISATGTKYNYINQAENYFYDYQVDEYYSYVNSVLDGASSGDAFQVYIIRETVDSFRDTNTRKIYMDFNKAHSNKQVTGTVANEYLIVTWRK